MSTIFEEDYEGGSHGTTISTTNTNFSFVSNNPAFDNTHVKNGALAAKVFQDTQRHEFTPKSDGAYYRAYVYFEAWPTGGTNIDNRLLSPWLGTTSAIGAVSVDSSGRVMLMHENDTTVLATSTTVLTLNTWHRLEVYYQPGAVLTCRIYAGADVDDPVANYTEELTGDPGVATSWDRMNFCASANQYTVWLDAIKADDATWVGPLGAPPPPLASAAGWGILMSPTAAPADTFVDTYAATY